MGPAGFGLAHLFWRWDFCLTKTTEKKYVEPVSPFHFGSESLFLYHAQAEIWCVFANRVLKIPFLCSLSTKNVEIIAVNLTVTVLPNSPNPDFAILLYSY